MKIIDICTYLESIAPLSYQEPYDNSGLITGSGDTEVKGALICIDSTEEVINEAIEKGCNLVIAHHPIVFSGLKKLNGRNYVERTLIKAIRNDIAIYAIHTNLDNVYNGVNARIAEKIRLSHYCVLTPKAGLLKKLVTFIPRDKAEKVKEAIFNAGGGTIGNYDSCSFNIEGKGTFRALEGSNPYVGNIGTHHQESETRTEVVFPAFKQAAIIKALIESHPYEEVAYDIYPLSNENNQIGSGLIGELEKEEEALDFLKRIKLTMNTSCIRHTKLLGRKIKNIAICGGSGSFLLSNAINAGADILITSDFKYHQFFDAENKIIIADIGHYESEQFTKELIYDILNEKFPKFAVYLSEINTNPVNYL